MLEDTIISQLMKFSFGTFLVQHQKRHFSKGLQHSDINIFYFPIRPLLTGIKT